jgi:hypothetical protein
VALEPCTAPGDSLAEAIAAGSARMLSAGEETTWWIAIEVSGVSLENI